MSSRATILLGRESVSRVDGAIIELVKNTYDINIITTPTTIENDKFDAILHCVAHNQFQHFNYHHHLTDKGFVYDIKGNISAQYQQQIINI